MFEKFGEFDSVEEINRAAAAQKAEEDEEAVVAIALENGLSRDDAEDYMDDCTDTLATPLQAAVGKLRLESEDLKLSGVLMDWVNELMDFCIDDTDFQRAVRKKGKDLAGFIALTAEKGFEQRCLVDKRIVEKTKEVKKIAGSHDFAIGIPDKKTRKELAKEYYLGQEQNHESV